MHVKLDMCIYKGFGKKDSGIRNELSQKGHANRTAQKIYSTSDTAEIVRTYDIML